MKKLRSNCVQQFCNRSEICCSTKRPSSNLHSTFNHPGGLPMKKRTKVLITLASIAVVGFSAYSGVWFYYKHNIWQPHIDNATVKLTAEWDDQCRITEYRYCDEETGDYYILQMPSFGAFDCCVSASAPPSVSDLGSIVITWLNSVLQLQLLHTTIATRYAAVRIRHIPRLRPSCVIICILTDWSLVMAPRGIPVMDTKAAPFMFTIHPL